MKIEKCIIIYFIYLLHSMTKIKIQSMNLERNCNMSLSKEIAFELELLGYEIYRLCVLKLIKVFKCS